MERRCKRRYMDRVKNYTVKVNGKHFFFDEIEVALDLVEATYETCNVVFADNLNNWEKGMKINDSIDFSELCDMYYKELN